MSKTFFYIILLVLAFTTCTKDKKPIAGQGLLDDISTIEVTEITTRTAKTGASIINNGSTDIVSKGVCWSLQNNPTISNSKVVAGSGSSSFVSQVTGLTPSTTYYIRAYATTSIATYYGAEKVFKTNDVVVPTVTTTPNVTGISQDTAISGGTVSVDGGGLISSQSNSGALALMIAHKTFGATDIELHGFDMHGSHYFGAYAEPLRNTPPTRFNEFQHQFSAIGAVLKKAGVRVVNRTPNSALRCFPFE